MFSVLCCVSGSGREPTALQLKLGGSAGRGRACAGVSGSLPGRSPPVLPWTVPYCPSLLPQDMGAGLAVVPLVGLLESIAVAKSFGKMPTTWASPAVPGAGRACLLLSASIFNSLSFYPSNTYSCLKKKKV